MVGQGGSLKNIQHGISKRICMIGRCDIKGVVTPDAARQLYLGSNWGLMEGRLVQYMSTIVVYSMRVKRGGNKITRKVQVGRVISLKRYGDHDT